MTKFDEYFCNWFKELVADHKEDKEWLEEMFWQLDYSEDVLDEGETCYEFLMSVDDVDGLYKKIFGFSCQVGPMDDLPSTDGFLTPLFRDAVEKYSFTNEMIEDMVEHCLDYDNPKDFFKDLRHGGCASGMVRMFVCNNDCENFYINYIDDLELFKEELEDELGEPIKNKQKLPHYTFVCWLCYEELARQIADELWEDEY